MDVSQNSKAEAFKITGDWGSQTKKLKEQYPQLTDADLKFETGKENDLFKRMETRLNKDRETVINIIKKVQPGRK